MSVTKLPSPERGPETVPIEDLIGPLNTVVGVLSEHELFETRRDDPAHPYIVEARVLASKALEALYEAYSMKQQ